jgi:hypothetical protein
MEFGVFFLGICLLVSFFWGNSGIEKRLDKIEKSLNRIAYQLETGKSKFPKDKIDAFFTKHGMAEVEDELKWQVLDLLRDQRRLMAIQLLADAGHSYKDASALVKDIKKELDSL